MSFRKHTWSRDDLEESQPQPADVIVSNSPRTAAVRYDRKKFKDGNRMQAACSIISEFCADSTVHGFRYFTEKGRHWTERVWWIGAFIVALVLCASLIMDVHTKWDQSPVIVSFAEKPMPVWEIPFPAVTICPETKTITDYFNFTAAYYIMMAASEPPYNMTADEIARMEAVIQICEPHLTDDFQLGENFTDHTIFDLIKEAAPTFNETMLFCKWLGDATNSVCPFFKPILTEEGICFTFNALNSKEIYRDGMNMDLKSVENNSMAEHWDLEGGYDKSVAIDSETYPYRVFGAGPRFGLFVLLRLFQQHFDYICRGPVQGFKVTLHTPGEVPQVSKHSFSVPSQKEVSVAVKPNVIITRSDGLHNYDPNRRQCFFASERNLKFFRVYTRGNCELECLSNYTKHVCGCVKFSMPRDSDTNICGAAKMKCYNDAEVSLTKVKFAESLTDDLETVKRGCNCLPSCTSITYDAEISQTEFDWIRLFSAYDNNPTEFLSTGIRPSRLTIFFKEPEFIISKRSELFSPTEFLANCGGLLGLFMGVSLLSIIEVIYYATLRLGCTLRMRHSKNNEIESQPPKPIT